MNTQNFPRNAPEITQIPSDGGLSKEKGKSLTEKKGKRGQNVSQRSVSKQLLDDFWEVDSRKL